MSRLLQRKKLLTLCHAVSTTSVLSYPQFAQLVETTELASAHFSAPYVKTDSPL